MSGFVVCNSGSRNDEYSHYTLCNCPGMQKGDSNFGFFDHGEVYTALGLLATDGVQLSQRGNRILAHKLVRLIERTFN